MRIDWTFPNPLPPAMSIDAMFHCPLLSACISVENFEDRRPPAMSTDAMFHYPLLSACISVGYFENRRPCVLIAYSQIHRHRPCPLMQYFPFPSPSALYIGGKFKNQLPLTIYIGRILQLPLDKNTCINETDPSSIYIGGMHRLNKPKSIATGSTFWRNIPQAISIENTWRRRDTHVHCHTQRMLIGICL